MLSIIYCLAIGVLSISINLPDFNQKTNTNHQKIFSNLSLNSISQTSHSQSSISNINEFNLRDFKDPNFGDCSILKLINNVSNVSYFQYTRISYNFLFHKRKSDIFYPFHYFW